MRHFPFHISLLLAVLAPPIHSAADAQVRLQWRLRPGEVITQTMTHSLKMTSDAKQLANMQQRMVTRWQVRAIDAEGIATVDQAVTHLRVQDTDGAKKAAPRYDSNTQAGSTGQAVTDPEKRSFDALAKARFQTKINRQGKVVNLAIPDDVAKSLRSAGVMGQMGQENFENLIRNASFEFPAIAISKGHRWTQTAETKTPLGTMIAESTMQYLGSEIVAGRNLEKIGVNIEMKFKPTGPFKVTLKDQKAAGTLLFDNARGRLHSSTTTQAFTMAVALPGKLMQPRTEQTIKIVFTDGEPKQASAQGAFGTPSGQARSASTGNTIR